MEAKQALCIPVTCVVGPSKNSAGPKNLTAEAVYSNGDDDTHKSNNIPSGM